MQTSCQRKICSAWVVAQPWRHQHCRPASGPCRELTPNTTKESSSQARRKPKIAKGARDMLPDQMAIREVAFDKVSCCGCCYCV